MCVRVRVRVCSSPFPTRWGQQPAILISRIFCPGHPPRQSAVPACSFDPNPSISLLVFYLAVSYQRLLALHCFLPFSAYVNTSDLLSYAIHSYLLTDVHTLYFFSQCYTFYFSQHPHCFLDNLFFLLSDCPTFCSLHKYSFTYSHVELGL